MISKLSDTYLILMLVQFLHFAISAMKIKIDSIPTTSARDELPLPSHQPNNFSKCNPFAVDITQKNSFDACVSLICPTLLLSMYGGNTRDTYSRALAPEVMTHLLIDNAYFERYKEKTGKSLNRRFVLPILNFL